MSYEFFEPPCREGDMFRLGSKHGGHSPLYYLVTRVVLDHVEGKGFYFWSIYYTGLYKCTSGDFIQFSSEKDSLLKYAIDGKNYYKFKVIRNEKIDD
jgi:hypothetical protein